MATKKVPLPRVAHEFLRTTDGRWCRSTLTLVHRWMSTRDLALSDLTPTHLEQFWQEQERKELAPSTWHARRSRVHKYLFWLHQKGRLRFAVDPPRLRHMRASLPASARRFLTRPDHRQHEPMVRNLHDWLHRMHIDLSELTPAHLKAFVRKPIATTIVKHSRYQLLAQLEPYLLWLHDLGLVPFRAHREVYRPYAVPDAVRDFVDSLRPVRKATTCDGYVSSLRSLHAWLDALGRPIEDIDRDDTERWLKALADRGLAPSTRTDHILHARSYLWWLAERGVIGTDPDDLLRPTDLPKIPTYLPRPFPGEADHELQRRFLKTGTLYGQALFLMRRSGVRIGELVRLEPRCLDEDLHGHVFLKVPLGKLDNERLVPLDDEAVTVARKLQAMGSVSAPLLLEPDLSRVTLMEKMRATLRDAADGLDIPGLVVSHRLRHSYATELLNAGVSLLAVMKLLGHRSIRMTMRYAAITQQTVVAEYYAAIAKTTAQYDLPTPSTDHDVPDLDRALLEVIYALRSIAGDDPVLRPQADRFNTRLHKLRHDIAQAFTDLANQ